MAKFPINRVAARVVRTYPKEGVSAGLIEEIGCVLAKALSADQSELFLFENNIMIIFLEKWSFDAHKSPSNAVP